MNVISHAFRRKWSLVGVLWLAVYRYKSVTILFFLIQAHSTHIPIHHDPLFSLLIHRRAYKNVLQSHKTTVGITLIAYTLRAAHYRHMTDVRWQPNSFRREVSETA